MFRRVVCLPKKAVLALAQTSRLVPQRLCLSVDPPPVGACFFYGHALLPLVLQTVRWDAVFVSPRQCTHATWAPAHSTKLRAESFASAAHPTGPNYFTVLGV